MLKNIKKSPINILYVKVGKYQITIPKEVKLKLKANYKVLGFI